ncbi:BRO-N domain-containing protein [Terrisporobacter vanillatitrophus]|uniref:BRO-N domain-containing protein n=1 Tax=Terrisporobacter vanillatitrophus TaxID=3058402 RepID=UPI003EC07F91
MFTINSCFIDERQVLGKEFRIYGTKESPLFLAKDVANWIEHSNTRMMLKSIDEEERVCVNNPYALKGQQEQWFLTEGGLYEVLMQSRKPKVN